MNCFGCGTAMRKGNRDGVLVDACPNCGGVWLDAGELEALERRESRERAGLLHQARQELAEEMQQVLKIVDMCPRCQAARLKRTHRHGVQIDYCPNCKGLYFDDRELERVMKASKEKASMGFLEGVLSLFRKPDG